MNENVFVSDRLFSRTHQWMLNVLCTVFQSDCYISFNCEEIFIKINNFLLCRAILQISEKNLSFFINYFLFFFYICEILSLSYLVSTAAWDNFWWFFWLRSHSHCIHLSCRSLRIPPYLFLDSYNQLLWSSSAWSSDVPSCLNLFKTW